MENKTRIGQNDYFLNITKEVAKRSTCLRRSVGCVLVDFNNHILATGYNGVPRNMDHCINDPCDGAQYDKGLHLEKCLAVHAEQNALIQCCDAENVYAVYCSVTPCMTCMKMLMNTKAEVIYADEIYNHSSALLLWLQSGREIHIRMCDEEKSTYRQLGEEEFISDPAGEDMEGSEEEVDEVTEE